MPKKTTHKRKEKAALPPVCVLDIVSRDKDGVLLACPHGSQQEKPKTVNSDTRHYDKNTDLVALSLRAGIPAAVGIGMRVLAKITPSEEEYKKTAPYQGHIIRILGKPQESILGIIRQNAGGYYFLEPIERKQPEFLLDAKALGGARAGDLVSAMPLGKHDKTTARFAKIQKIIGAAAAEKALSAIALYRHHIPVEFPPQVLAEAQQATAQKLNGSREDLRHIPFITIDPATAKDHDDAVYAEADKDKKNSGGYTIFVAIADVAAYVRPHTAMDIEARRRGNSVYFPDRVVPMLPEEISNNLCSLREGEDRPALAVMLTYNAQGHKLRHKFHRILMRNHAKLSYEQAQAAIDGQPDSKTKPLLAPVLKPLWAAYKILQQARNERQPLELNLPERKIILDENGRVSAIHAAARLDAHKLIEEFMIAANIAAAETLKIQNKPLLFRIHDSPAPEKSADLKNFLQTIGLKLGGGTEITAQKFNHILKKSSGRAYETLVNQLILRVQAQAEYNPINIGHFGLKLRNYAHFTSPIRRYADLLLHRSLISALHFGDDGITKKQQAELPDIAKEISAAERRAMLAERETNDRLIADYLSSHIGAHFKGNINGVTRAGLFITLSETGADGFIPIGSLKNLEKNNPPDYYYFDEEHFALVRSRGRKGFQLGDSVEIELKEVQKSAGTLQFAMLSLPKKLRFSVTSFHKHKTNHHKKPSRSHNRNRY